MSNIWVLSKVEFDSNGSTDTPIKVSADSDALVDFVKDLDPRYDIVDTISESNTISYEIINCTNRGCLYLIRQVEII